MLLRIQNFYYYIDYIYETTSVLSQKFSVLVSKQKEAYNCLSPKPLVGAMFIGKIFYP